MLGIAISNSYADIEDLETPTNFPSSVCESLENLLIYIHLILYTLSKKGSRSNEKVNATLKG